MINKGISQIQENKQKQEEHQQLNMQNQYQEIQSRNKKRPCYMEDEKQADFYHDNDDESEQDLCDSDDNLQFIMPTSTLKGKSINISKKKSQKQISSRQQQNQQKQHQNQIIDNNDILISEIPEEQKEFLKYQTPATKKNQNYQSINSGNQNLNTKLEETESKRKLIDTEKVDIELQPLSSEKQKQQEQQPKKQDNIVDLQKDQEQIKEEKLQNQKIWQQNYEQKKLKNDIIYSQEKRFYNSTKSFIDHIQSCFNYFCSWLVPILFKKQVQKRNKQLTQAELLIQKGESLFDSLCMWRRVFRCIVLSIIWIFIIFGSMLIHYHRAYDNGTFELQIKENQNLNIVAKNCLINLKEHTQNSDKIYIDYFIHHKFENLQKQESDYGFEIDEETSSINIVALSTYDDTKYCYLFIQVPQDIENYNDFNFLCEENSECLFTYQGTQKTFQNINFVGTGKQSVVAANIQDIQYNNFNFNIDNRGLLYLQNFKANQNSNIKIGFGEVVLQSQYNTQLNFTNPFESICYSAPTIQQVDPIKCNLHTDSLQQSSSNGMFTLHPGFELKGDSERIKELVDGENSTLYGEGENSTTQDQQEYDGETFKENNQQVCKGIVNLCAKHGCETLQSEGLVEDLQKFNVTVVYNGNVYGNFLEYQNFPPNFNITSQTLNTKSSFDLIKGGIYEQGLGYNQKIQQDLDDIIGGDGNLSTEPIWIVDLGWQLVQLTTQTTWVKSINPSFALMRPWWLASWSFSLLITQTYELKGFLQPGICPYSTSYTIEQYEQIQDFVFHSLQTDDEKDSASISFIKAERRNLPELIYRNETGVSQIEKDSRNKKETWYTIEDSKDFADQKEVFDFNKSSEKYGLVIFTHIFSMGVSLIFALTFTYLLIKYLPEVKRRLFALTSQYIRYKKFDKKDKKKKKEKKSKQDEDKNEIALNYQLENVSDNQQKQEDKLPGILTFLDFQMWLILRASQASHKTFFKLLFESFKDQQAYNMVDDYSGGDFSNDSLFEINTDDLKILYEKFCFLNHYNEEKLQDDHLVKRLQKKYKYVYMADGNSNQSFIGLKPHKKIRNINWNTIGEPVNSLDIFLSAQFQVTDLEDDEVAVPDFIEMYQGFCQMNKVKEEEVIPHDIKKKLKIKLVFSTGEKLAMKKNADKKLRKKISLKKGIGYLCSAIGQKIKQLWQLESDQNVYMLQVQRVEKSFEFIQEPGMFAIKYLQTMNKKKVLKNEINKIFGFCCKPFKVYFTQEEEIFIDLIYGSYWAITDTMTVVFHTCISLLLILSIYAFLTITQIFYYPYSQNHPMNVLSKSDILNGTFFFPRYFSYSEPYVEFLFYIMIVFLVIQILDEIYTLSRAKFPVARQFEKEQSRGLYGFLGIFLWQKLIGILFFAFLIFYLCMNCLWLLLGAIIDPNYFLIYASSVVVLITFVTTKIQEIKELQGGFTSYIQEYIMNSYTKKIQNIIGNLQAKQAQFIEAASKMEEQLDSALEQISEKVKLPDKVKKSMEDIKAMFKVIENSKDGNATLEEIDQQSDKMEQKIIQELEDEQKERFMHLGLTQPMSQAVIDQVLKQDKKQIKIILSQEVSDNTNKMFSINLINFILSLSNKGVRDIQNIQQLEKQIMDIALEETISNQEIRKQSLKYLNILDKIEDMCNSDVQDLHQEHQQDSKSTSQVYIFDILRKLLEQIPLEKGEDWKTSIELKFLDQLFNVLDQSLNNNLNSKDLQQQFEELFVLLGMPRKTGLFLTQIPSQQYSQVYLYRDIRIETETHYKKIVETLLQNVISQQSLNSKNYASILSNIYILMVQIMKGEPLDSNNNMVEQLQKILLNEFNIFKDYQKNTNFQNGFYQITTSLPVIIQNQKKYEKSIIEISNMTQIPVPHIQGLIFMSTQSVCFKLQTSSRVSVLEKTDFGQQYLQDITKALKINPIIVKKLLKSIYQSKNISENQMINKEFCEYIFKTLKIKNDFQQITIKTALSILDSSSIWEIEKIFQIFLKQFKNYQNYSYDQNVVKLQNISKLSKQQQIEKEYEKVIEKIQIVIVKFLESSRNIKLLKSFICESFVIQNGQYYQKQLESTVNQVYKKDQKAVRKSQLIVQNSPSNNLKNQSKGNENNKQKDSKDVEQAELLDEENPLQTMNNDESTDFLNINVNDLNENIKNLMKSKGKLAGEIKFYQLKNINEKSILELILEIFEIFGLQKTYKNFLSSYFKTAYLKQSPFGFNGSDRRRNIQNLAEHLNISNLSLTQLLSFTDLSYAPNRENIIQFYIQHPLLISQPARKSINIRYDINQIIDFIIQLDKFNPTILNTIINSQNNIKNIVEGTLNKEKNMEADILLKQEQEENDLGFDNLVKNNHYFTEISNIFTEKEVFNELLIGEKSQFIDKLKLGKLVSHITQYFGKNLQLKETKKLLKNFFEFYFITDKYNKEKEIEQNQDKKLQNLYLQNDDIVILQTIKEIINNTQKQQNNEKQQIDYFFDCLAVLNYQPNFTLIKSQYQPSNIGHKMYRFLPVLFEQKLMRYFNSIEDKEGIDEEILMQQPEQIIQEEQDNNQENSIQLQKQENLNNNQDNKINKYQQEAQRQFLIERKKNNTKYLEFQNNFNKFVKFSQMISVQIFKYTALKYEELETIFSLFSYQPKIFMASKILDISQIVISQAYALSQLVQPNPYTITPYIDNILDDAWYNQICVKGNLINSEALNLLKLTQGQISLNDLEEFIQVFQLKDQLNIKVLKGFYCFYQNQQFSQQQIDFDFNVSKISPEQYYMKCYNARLGLIEKFSSQIHEFDHHHHNNQKMSSINTVGQNQKISKQKAKQCDYSPQLLEHFHNSELFRGIQKGYYTNIVFLRKQYPVIKELQIFGINNFVENSIFGVLGILKLNQYVEDYHFIKNYKVQQGQKSEFKQPKSNSFYKCIQLLKESLLIDSDLLNTNSSSLSAFLDPFQLSGKSLDKQVQVLRDQQSTETIKTDNQTTNLNSIVNFKIFMYKISKISETELMLFIEKEFINRFYVQILQKKIIQNSDKYENPKQLQSYITKYIKNHQIYLETFFFNNIMQENNNSYQNLLKIFKNQALELCFLSLLKSTQQFIQKVENTHLQQIENSDNQYLEYYLFRLSIRLESILLIISRLQQLRLFERDNDYKNKPFNKLALLQLIVGTSNPLVFYLQKQQNYNILDKLLTPVFGADQQISFSFLKKQKLLNIDSLLHLEQLLSNRFATLIQFEDETMKLHLYIKNSRKSKNGIHLLTAEQKQKYSKAFVSIQNVENQIQFTQDQLYDLINSNQELCLQKSKENIQSQDILMEDKIIDNNTKKINYLQNKTEKRSTLKNVLPTKLLQKQEKEQKNRQEVENLNKQQLRFVQNVFKTAQQDDIQKLLYIDKREELSDIFDEFYHEQEKNSLGTQKDKQFNLKLLKLLNLNENIYHKKQLEKYYLHSLDFKQSISQLNKQKVHMVKDILNDLHSMKSNFNNMETLLDFAIKPSSIKTMLQFLSTYIDDKQTNLFIGLFYLRLQGQKKCELKQLIGNFEKYSQKHCLNAGFFDLINVPKQQQAKFYQSKQDSIGKKDQFETMEQNEQKELHQKYYNMDRNFLILQFTKIITKSLLITEKHSLLISQLIECFIGIESSWLYLYTYKLKVFDKIKVPSTNKNENITDEEELEEEQEIQDVEKLIFNKQNNVSALEQSANQFLILIIQAQHTAFNNYRQIFGDFTLKNIPKTQYFGQNILQVLKSLKFNFNHLSQQLNIFNETIFTNIQFPQQFIQLKPLLIKIFTCQNSSDTEPYQDFNKKQLFQKILNPDYQIQSNIETKSLSELNQQQKEKQKNSINFFDNMNYEVRNFLVSPKKLNSIKEKEKLKQIIIEQLKYQQQELNFVYSPISQEYLYQVIPKIIVEFMYQKNGKNVIESIVTIMIDVFCNEKKYPEISKQIINIEQQIKDGLLNSKKIQLKTKNEILQNLVSILSFNSVLNFQLFSKNTPMIHILGIKMIQTFSENQNLDLTEMLKVYTDLFYYKNDNIDDAGFSNISLEEINNRKNAKQNFDAIQLFQNNVKSFKNYMLNINENQKNYSNQVLQIISIIEENLNINKIKNDYNFDPEFQPVLDFMKIMYSFFSGFVDLSKKGYAWNLIGKKDLEKQKQHSIIEFFACQIPSIQQQENQDAKNIEIQKLKTVFNLVLILNDCIRNKPQNVSSLQYLQNYQNIMQSCICDSINQFIRHMFEKGTIFQSLSKDFNERILQICENLIKIFMQKLINSQNCVLNQQSQQDSNQEEFENIIKNMKQIILETLNDQAFDFIESTPQNEELLQKNTQETKNYIVIKNQLNDLNKKLEHQKQNLQNITLQSQEVQKNQEFLKQFHTKYAVQILEYNQKNLQSQGNLEVEEDQNKKIDFKQIDINQLENIPEEEKLQYQKTIEIYEKSPKLNKLQEDIQNMNTAIEDTQKQIQELEDNKKLQKESLQVYKEHLNELIKEDSFQINKFSEYIVKYLHLLQKLRDVILPQLEEKKQKLEKLSIDQYFQNIDTQHSLAKEIMPQIVEGVCINYSSKSTQYVINIINSIQEFVTKKYENTSLDFYKILKIPEEDIEELKNELVRFSTNAQKPLKLLYENKQMAKNKVKQQGKDPQEDNIQNAKQKIDSDQNLTSKDMFKLINPETKGQVTQEEFQQFYKSIGVKLSSHRVRQIFAFAKKDSPQDDERQDTLNQEEFEKANEYIQSSSMRLAMDKMGLSKSKLYFILIYLIFALILIFTFIILGVQAFAFPGTFGAIINSIFPMAGGGILSKSNSKNPKQTLKSQRLKEIVKESLEIIESKV